MPFRVGPLPKESLGDAAAILVSASGDLHALGIAEEKLFGASPLASEGWAIGAWSEDGTLAGVASGAGRWLRVLAVAPGHRRKGAGTALVAQALALARAAGADTLRTGDQPGNYWQPGISAEDAGTRAFFERQGFAEVAGYSNLVVSLAGNPALEYDRIAKAIGRASDAGYEVRRAAPADAPALEVLATTFARAWAFEVARGDVHLAMKDGAPVAFACHDGNNRGLGWFGPAGTLEHHRGNGLGEALLLMSLAEVAATGKETTEIAWIGPRVFYKRVIGIAGERNFTVLERSALDS